MAFLIELDRIRFRGPLAIRAALLIAGASALCAQTIPALDSYSSFLARTRTAQYSQFRDLAGTRVTNAANFEQMREHVLTMYDGVKPSHSFLVGSHPFDCVPVDQQPSVRLLGISTIAQPPVDAPVGSGSVAAQFDEAHSFDSLGNSVTCAANSIPMRRITLEDLTQFPSLADFLKKEPDVSAQHKYSFTYQYADTLGGTSTLNLWNPTVNTGLGEIFSLSQEWYIGGSGSATQTAEVGWQNYPGFYGTTDSVPFIYWTADDYTRTGCYNLDCPGFVQVNNSWTLGAPFSNYSTPGGKQYDVSMTYHLLNGNWWLALGGTWVGYYPSTIYNGGQLTKNTELIEFGSEAVGYTIWPPEGSGAFSNAGYGFAAYQRALSYYSTTGGVVTDSLTADEPSPACYTITGPGTTNRAGWNSYFYLGGPGGSGC